MKYRCLSNAIGALLVLAAGAVAAAAEPEGAQL
jgi:hypothetical protein